jgi:hypothetical protein
MQPPPAFAAVSPVQSGRGEGVLRVYAQPAVELAVSQ